jgi:hypothetical protein
MRRLFLALIALSLPAMAVAGTCNLTTSAGQDTRLERDRLRKNKQACASVGLVATCTQAQARALNPALDIYSDVCDMVDRKLIREYVQGLQGTDTGEDQPALCAWWNAPTTTQAQRNADCAKAGLANGCDMFPTVCPK